MGTNPSNRVAVEKLLSELDKKCHLEHLHVTLMPGLNLKKLQNPTLPNNSFEECLSQ
jgi:hypothetical protein